MSVLNLMALLFLCCFSVEMIIAFERVLYNLSSRTHLQLFRKKNLPIYMFIKDKFKIIIFISTQCANKKYTKKVAFCSKTKHESGHNYQ